MSKEIAAFHFLTRDIINCSHEEQVRIGCESGIKWIQLRVKNKNEREILRIAVHARTITAQFGVTLIINDHPYIAKEVHADGVHLGQEDISWRKARKILGKDCIIGLSTHSISQIMEAKEAEIDYVGLGPYRLSDTKQNENAVLESEGLKNIISCARKVGMLKAIIAIGGIQLKDVSSILSTDASGIAVSSAVNFSTKPEEIIKKFLSQCELNSFSEIHR